jgi:hypothetical protein
MGTFPALPATQVRPAPDPLETFQRVIGIQNLTQEGQLRDVQLRQAKLQLDDEDRIRTAWQNSNGDADTFVRNMTQAGVLPRNILAMQEGILAMKKKAADLDQTSLENTVRNHDLIRGQLLSIAGGPQEQKQQNWDSTLTSLEKAGAIKPGQYSHQYPGDDIVTSVANHFGLGSVIAKESIDATAANARAQQAKASTGELLLNMQKFAQSPEELIRRSQVTDANGLPTPDAAAARKILTAQRAQAVATAGATAGAQAAAKFPYEARLEQLRQQGDPVFAFDPTANGGKGQTVFVSRDEANARGFTNIVKVGEAEVDKAKTAAMQLGDAAMNLQAYKNASQKMDELSGSDIRKVSRVIGSDKFKASFLGIELPADWANKLYQQEGWLQMPESAKDAVVNYIAARPAAISLLRAINPGVRLTESQIETELKNIPDPTTPSDVRDRQFARLDRNIAQASKTLVKIPGVDLPSEIQANVSRAPGAGAPGTPGAGTPGPGVTSAPDSSVFRRALDQFIQSQRAQPATGQHRLPYKPQNAIQVGDRVIVDGRTVRVSRIYSDGSFDEAPPAPAAP